MKFVDVIEVLSDTSKNLTIGKHLFKTIYQQGKTSCLKIKSSSYSKEGFMKKIFTVIFVAMLLFLGSAIPSQAQDGENMITFGMGAFVPNDDFGKAGFDNGPDLTLGYVRLVGDYLGLGVEINSYSMEAKEIISGNVYEYEVLCAGAEFMAYLQPNRERVQPYVGVGFAGYSNTWVQKRNGVTTWKDDSGSGYGVVAKAGLRAFVTDNVFLGGFAKYLTNELDVPYGSSMHDTQLGGVTVNLEAGYRF
jgi:outer membrane protein W